jgi:Na+-driven multidrug efflux pump
LGFALLAAPIPEMVLKLVFPYHFSQLFLGAEVVLESAMGGAGWTLWPMIGSSTITVLRLPIGAWAAAQWGTSGLWWTLALTAAARGLLMAALWGSGRWRRVRV